MSENFARQLAPALLLKGWDARQAVAAGLARPLAPGLAYGAAVEAWRQDDGVSRRLLPLAQAPDFAKASVAMSPDPFTALGLTAARPLVMGIVNTTPDSFSDGGRYLGQAGIDHGRRLIEAGADLLDIGGESTRPGAPEVPVSAEIDRVCPVIEALSGDGAVISVDTRKAAVMKAAVEAGAAIVNDVSALAFDPAAASYLATVEVPVVLMHTQGTPEVMQADPRYRDVCFDVVAELAASIARAEAAGIARQRLITDPGIGFGKTLAHNLALIDGLAALHALGLPILLGVSRKSFISRLGFDEAPDQRLGGSLAAALAGLDRGARVLRVHDVRQTVQAVRVWQASHIDLD